MKNRSREPELMDKGPDYYSIAEYNDCLKKLGIVGRVLGGDGATFRALNSLGFTPASILDVGCGGGSFALRCARAYPRTNVVGIDIDQKAIEYAHKQLERYYASHSPLQNLLYHYRHEPSLSEPPKSFDVVMATLVLHHLDDEQIIDFFARARRVARKAIIINDLERSALSYFLFRCISPLFCNRMVSYDGALSIKKSFSRKELERYLVQAGFNAHEYSISWQWAFRWIIVVKIGC